MTIRGHVLSVKSTGDKLKVKLQGKADFEGEWCDYNVIEFTCEDRDSQRRALYVGREITIKITPE